jgi:hypothetical protein
MARMGFGLAMGLTLGMLNVAGCGVAPLMHVSAPSDHVAAKSVSWPPTSWVATVETISGGHSPADGGNVVNVPAAQARYSLPNGLTFANHRLYVSDARNNVVTVLANQNGALFASEFAGSANPAHDQDGTGKQAQFIDPQDITAASDGTLYLVEYHGASIRSIRDSKAGGVVKTVVAPTQHPVLGGPYGIAVGKSGTIYVSDLDRKQVVKVSKGADDRVQQTVIYKAKTDADPVPMCLTVDEQENVYFSSGFGLYSMTATGQNLLKVVEHFPKFAWDLAYANHHIVVADMTYVLDVDLATHKVQTLAGNGTMGGDDGVGDKATFGNAASICFGEAGSLYVADGENHRICRLAFN